MSYSISLEKTLICAEAAWSSGKGGVLGSGPSSATNLSNDWHQIRESQTEQDWKGPQWDHLIQPQLSTAIGMLEKIIFVEEEAVINHSR